VPAGKFAILSKYTPRKWKCLVMEQGLIGLALFLRGVFVVQRQLLFPVNDN